ncbi:MAG: hypothetical protein WBB42_08495 [Polyangiales bacterium]
MRFVIALVLGGALALSGCDSDGGSEGGAAPVITKVEWSTPSGCVDGTVSDYTVTVTADSDAMDPVYNGSVTGCTGDIDAMISVIKCPNAADYVGSVVVSDGNGSDSVSFTIGVCDETGSFTP